VHVFMRVVLLVSIMLNVNIEIHNSYQIFIVRHYFYIFYYLLVEPNLMRIKFGFFMFQRFFTMVSF
jgi:hypothetical protein